MRQIFSNETFQTGLMQRGYISTPVLFDEEINFLLSEFEKLLPDNNVKHDVKGMKFETNLHYTLFDSNADYRRKANNLIREVFSHHIKRILVDYEIYTSNFFIKQSGGGKIPAHQHPPLIADLDDTPVTFWCPLVDADERNGTLKVVEGSHKIIPEIPMPCNEPSFHSFEDKLFREYMKPIKTKAGSAVVFDDNLIHGSEVNNSSTPRPAVQVSCIPNDAKRVFYFLDRNDSKKDFEVFEVDDEFFVENSITGMITPTSNLKKIGTVKNNNRPISENEFSLLLKNGDRIRSKIYSPKDSTESSQSQSFLGKLKSYFIS